MASVGLFGLHLGYTRWNPSILTFRHAVSLDERRTKFQPNLCGLEGIPTEKPTKRDGLGKTTESKAAGPSKIRKVKKQLNPAPASGNQVLKPKSQNATRTVKVAPPNPEVGGQAQIDSQPIDHGITQQNNRE